MTIHPTLPAEPPYPGHPLSAPVRHWAREQAVATLRTAAADPTAGIPPLTDDQLTRLADLAVAGAFVASRRRDHRLGTAPHRRRRCPGGRRPAARRPGRLTCDRSRRRELTLRVCGRQQQVATAFPCGKGVRS